MVYVLMINTPTALSLDGRRLGERFGVAVGDGARSSGAGHVPLDVVLQHDRV